MISVGPCPQLSGLSGEINFPIIRDMDTFCYERQHGADMEVGSYAHRAILHEPEEILDRAVSSQTALHVRRLRPAARAGLRADARAARRRGRGDALRHQRPALADLDGNPILGESNVKGLWTAAAVWIKEGRASAARSPSG